MVGTIKDLIFTTLERPRLDYGNFADVYDIPHPGFEGYILRKVRDSFDPEALKHTTSLVPVSREYGPLNFGQPLLSYEGVSFNFRQSGLSFRNILKDTSGRYQSEPRGSDRIVEVLDNMLQIDSHLYTRVTRRLKHLTSIGKDFDYKGDNLLFDPVHGWGIIDTLPKHPEGDSQNRMRSLSVAVSNNLFPDGEITEGMPRADEIVDKYNAAMGRFNRAAKEEGLSDFLRLYDDGIIQPKIEAPKTAIKVKSIPISMAPKDLQRHLSFIVEAYRLERT